MKNVFKFLSLFLVTVLLTGCAMKEEFGIVVGKDKNVKLEFLIAQDNEMIDAMIDMGDSSDDSDETEQKQHTDQERWSYIDSSNEDNESYKDFTKTKYDKDGFKGYTYTVDLGNIDNLIADNDDKATLDNIGKDSKIFTKKGNTYSLNINMSNDQTTQMEQYASQVSFDVKVKVTLPNKAKTNNATTVEGNTYIWDLTKAKSIDLSFDLNESNNTLLIVGVVAAVVVIGAACVVVLTKKRQDNKTQM